MSQFSKFWTKHSFFSKVSSVKITRFYRKHKNFTKKKHRNFHTISKKQYRKNSKFWVKTLFLYDSCSTRGSIPVTCVKLYRNKKKNEENKHVFKKIRLHHQNIAYVSLLLCMLLLFTFLQYRECVCTKIYR